MTKAIVLLAASAAFSQALADQQPSWIAIPGSSATTMRMSPEQGQAGPVAGKPFAATEVKHTVQLLADGSHADQSEIGSFARDDRGRMRTGNAKIVVIYDPVAGVTNVLDLASKTYTQTKLAGNITYYWMSVNGDVIGTRVVSQSGGGQLPASGIPTASSGERTEELSPRFLNGLSAKGSRVTKVIPAGTFGNARELLVVNERWYSDDMQILLKSSNMDPRFGTTTYELTDLIQGPPDPALFQVPAGYRLRGDSRH